MNVFRSKIVICALLICTASIILIYWLPTRKVRFAPCSHQLLIIEMCKQDWAANNNKHASDVPTMDDLRLELKSYAIQYHWTNGVPVCPDGGTYIIGSVGERPKCSIGGPDHSLP